ncbi:hypothetical protein [Companilactobacillus sp.]|uniref:hypothetical protein n=1 Tax=Companilactobacillus sp. TaxID=2767905 RepID=UPI00261D94D3|nr:hypothetical protein [Companilactobacillus sp.]
MKKRIIALIGVMSIITFFGLFTDNVYADDNSQSSNNSETTAQINQKAAQDFIDNYVNTNIVVKDDSLSLAKIDRSSVYDSGITLAALYHPMVVETGLKKYILRDSSKSKYADTLSHFDFGAYRLDPKTKQPITNYEDIDNTSLVDGLEFFVYDGSKVIATKRINVKVENPTVHPLVGTVMNNGSVNPLVDENLPGWRSNRSVAPGSNWYTDEYELNLNTGKYQYRVSTTEWVEGDVTIKSDQSTGLNINSELSSIRPPIFTVTGKSVAGEPLFTSDGGVWNFTLPSGTKWTATRVGHDQNGILYYEVSNNAYVRVYEQ